MGVTPGHWAQRAQRALLRAVSPHMAPPGVHGVPKLYVLATKKIMDAKPVEEELDLRPCHDLVRRWRLRKVDACCLDRDFPGTSDVECTPVHDRVRFFELELDRLRRSYGHRITFAGVAVD